MAINPDGSRLVFGKRSLSREGESKLTLWSRKSGRQLLAFKRQGIVEAISFSPDGNRLVAAFQPSGSDHIKPIQVWDATPLPDETETK